MKDFPGSWQWRHWYVASFLLLNETLTEILARGCVSGEQCVNLQKDIGKDENGEYKWDYIDGWEELE
jgi:hypothetical protein